MEKKICHVVGAAEVEGLDIARGGGDLVIAVDRGLETLKRFGVPFDVAIGDFDSLGYVPDADKVLSYPPEKDDTDTILAIRYGLTLGFDAFALYGCLGGALSHTLANIQTLAFIEKRGARGVLMGDDAYAVLIRERALKLDAAAGLRVSIFAFGGEARGVSLRGFDYELIGSTLSPDYPIGVSNRAAGPMLIEVERGALVAIFEGIMPSPLDLLL